MAHIGGVVVAMHTYSWCYFVVHSLVLHCEYICISVFMWVHLGVGVGVGMYVGVGVGVYVGTFVGTHIGGVNIGNAHTQLVWVWVGYTR